MSDIVSTNRPLMRLTPDERKAMLERVLDRALDGEKQADIAKDLGVHQTRLSQLLRQYATEEWQSVQIARALSAIDKCEEEIEVASDMLSLSRARERLRSAQWQLEKLDRRLFGENNQSNQGSAVQINIGIVRRPKESIGQDSDKSLTINVDPEQDV